MPTITELKRRAREFWASLDIETWVRKHYRQLFCKMPGSDADRILDKLEELIMSETGENVARRAFRKRRIEREERRKAWSKGERL